MTKRKMNIRYSVSSGCKRYERNKFDTLIISNGNLSVDLITLYHKVLSLFLQMFFECNVLQVGQIVGIAKVQEWPISFHAQRI